MEQAKHPQDSPSFESLRTNKCVYVDKTSYIHEMVNSGSHIFFLNRPRRFGKSLFVTTLQAYFSGKKELFKGLSIYELEKDWESYPILYFDFKDIDHKSATQLEKYLRNYLVKTARQYEVEVKFDAGLGRAFASLISDIAIKTGKQVVILIDEYDKGIIEVLENKEQLETNYKILKLFYSAIKSQNHVIHNAFITGITNFRLYDNLTGGLNCFNDLTMHYKYAAVCGFTMEEVLHSFPFGIQRLCQTLNMSQEEIADQLQRQYGGYRFTHMPILVINPFDLIQTFNSNRIENFWSDSCKPMVFSKCLIRQNKLELSSLSKLVFCSCRLGDTFSEDNLIPLLYQTGYLTIKDYCDGYYKLGIPNKEVKEALVKECLTY